METVTVTPPGRSPGSTGFEGGEETGRSSLKSVKKVCEEGEREDAAKAGYLWDN